jgi:hypothetical protein
LAPRFVTFYNRDWQQVGTRTSLANIISTKTGISEEYLEDITSCSVAVKMSWAARRQASVAEDSTYGLLGLFGVNMALIYGEGASQSFVRLQAEIIKQSDDESILAWTGKNMCHLKPSLTVAAYGLAGDYFAGSPLQFDKTVYPNLTRIAFDVELRELLIINRGLIMTPLVYRKRVERLPLDKRIYVPLNFGRYQLGLPILFTLCLEDHGSTFKRVDCSSTLWASPESEDWQNQYELLI